jgi:membrane-bound lytic murein transglycosylase B
MRFFGLTIAAIGIATGAVAGPNTPSAPLDGLPAPPSPAYLGTAIPQDRDQIVQAQYTNNAGFNRWIANFRGRALSEGVSGTVFDRACTGISYDADVIERDRNQAEFVKPIWEYLDTAVSDTRVRNGRQALRQNRRVLDQIEQRYGVDREVVVAVWGLESAYGSYRGDNNIIQALATLAYDGRRGSFFEGQLIAALKILQNGDTSPANMTGSWAGAMGHTQFIPTSYLAYAVDFDGDGRRDIWADDPTDALASTAAYLSRFGWVSGQPWGVEVQLPRGFDYTLANRSTTRMPSDWARIGVVGMNGQAVPDHGSASILLPAGSDGVAMMIFRNFAVIERYNTADAYVIGVGHLADRLRGGDAFEAGWPRGDRGLLAAERRELQQRLTDAGFSTQGVAGRIGPNTINAIRRYQQANGLVPDGYASLRLLERLR